MVVSYAVALEAVSPEPLLPIITGSKAAKWVRAIMSQ